jgi:broad specificity phosphatase PhoE
MEKTTAIILMRHGQTDWNKAHKVMGWQDIPLNDQGRAQVRQQADFLKPGGVDRIIASPLSRTAESAKIVAETLGLTFETDDRLKEFNLGRWVGLTRTELFNDEHYLRYRQDPLAEKFPTDEGIQDVLYRAVNCINELRGQDAKRILCVTHSGIIKLLIAYYMGSDIRNFYRLKISNASLSVISFIGTFIEISACNFLSDFRYFTDEV